MILIENYVFQKEKYLSIDLFEMNDIMVKKAQGKQQVEQSFVGIRTHFLNYCICIYIICNAFFMIECSSNAIDLFIFVIYDV